MLEDHIYDWLRQGYTRGDIEEALANAEAYFDYGVGIEAEDSQYTEFELQEMALEERAERAYEEGKLSGLL